MKHASWIVTLLIFHGAVLADGSQVTFNGKQGSVWLQQQVTYMNIPDHAPNNRVCLSLNGEPARVLDKIGAAGSPTFWLRVEVLTGNCKGKIGWVLSDNVVPR